MRETENNVPENKVLEEPGERIMEEPKIKNSGTGNKKSILPLILILALLGAAGYIGYDKFIEYETEKKAEIFNEGAQYGAQSLILQIFDEATTCTPLPINNGSLEINLIATECLNTAPPVQ